MQPVVMTGVSRTMKRVGLVLAALAVVGGVLWYLQRPGKTAASASTGGGPAGSASSSGPVAAVHKPITKVTKLADQAERQQLADRIAKAQAARGAVRAAPMPRLPDQPDNGPPPIAGVVDKTSIRAAMQEVIPYIQDCYQRAIPTLASPDFDLKADFSLIGDPEIGTLVEVKSLADGDGKALGEQLDACFKDALQLLALPPLEEGDRIEVRYPFAFRQG